MKHIAVFCGSSDGSEPQFAEQAYLVGQTIARRGYGLVYGGARVGLMGAVADGALAEGAEVIGVIPLFLQQKELAHKGITHNHVVTTMHERKAKMNELSDAIITLPGGYGTMEELFEMLTWSQLALHKKPIALLNTDGFYDSLLTLRDMMIEKHFLKEEYRNLLMVDTDINKLIDRIESHIPLTNDKWFEAAK